MVVWHHGWAVGHGDHADTSLGTLAVEKGLHAEVQGGGAFICQAKARLVEEHPCKVQSLHLADGHDFGPVFHSVQAVLVDEMLEMHKAENGLGALLVSQGTATATGHAC